jgi:AcrR family transcriptional regulator
VKVSAFVENQKKMPDSPSDDRRVQKTRALLRQAIGALIHEKPYDQIAVKEILARANVGRSTFYEHFRDKDELLADAFQGVVQGGGGAVSSRLERVLRFSRPILEHIEQQRRAGGLADRDARARGVLHARLARELAQVVNDELEGAARDRGAPEARLPRALLVEHVVSSFMNVVEWWVTRKRAAPARQVEELFHALARPALAAAFADTATMVTLPEH